VPYEAYGPDVRTGIADMNRPMFLGQLATEWIPALPDIEARLRRAEPPARVADLGCGSGWSAIAVARAFPEASVDGIDMDQASIAQARRNAEQEGVQDRVSFTQAPASRALAGRYDLITLFETLHDMADPVDVLRSAREALADGGAVLVGDERVGETFTAPGDELDRFNYGWSALHCLPAARLSPDVEGTGTVMRPDTLRRYAQDAGFRSTTVLPVEHEFWRFYRLDP
jgi:ubiquinone/menaquinone biosynthesis C-methylase UbiE